MPFPAPGRRLSPSSGIAPSSTQPCSAVMQGVLPSEDGSFIVVRLVLWQINSRSWVNTDPASGCFSHRKRQPPEENLEELTSRVTESQKILEGISGDHLGKLPTQSKTITGITAVVGGTSCFSFSFCACGTGMTPHWGR